MLAGLLERLLADHTTLSTAAARAGRFGRRDATQRLARLVLDLDLGAAPSAALRGRAA
jgi:UDP-N-acetylglucosamine:LPS N-acetylglucosamine transferase